MKTQESSLIPAIPLPQARRATAIAAYWELSKPRMVAMILVTAFVGYHLAAGDAYAPRVLLHLLSGTAILAAAAFALNQALEKVQDGLMERTRARPVPTGRISQPAAFAFGLAGFAIGLLQLALCVNALTAILGAATVVLYAAVYTPMKRHSSLNTLVGAIPGAIPPLMGWCAASGSIGLGGVLLFALLFFWQMPHFLALAWMYRDDYIRGGYRMLSVTDPTGRACFRHILLQSALLALVSVFPFLSGHAGVWYLACALTGGGLMIWSGLVLYQSGTRVAARRVFLASLLYLPCVLLAIAFDKNFFAI